jgi:hypothetical protein
VADVRIGGTTPALDRVKGGELGALDELPRIAKSKWTASAASFYSHSRRANTKPFHLHLRMPWTSAITLAAPADTRLYTGPIHTLDSPSSIRSPDCHALLLRLPS